jgi:hypothetical protein
VGVDEEVAWRNSGGWQLLVRPLSKRGEGGEPIFGVPDPRLSLATNGGELRP